MVAAMVARNLPELRSPSVVVVDVNRDPGIRRNSPKCARRLVYVTSSGAGPHDLSHISVRSKTSARCPRPSTRDIFEW
jgi:hypothetical protein